MEAVRRYGRIFQHGTQRRAWDGVRKASELARNGRLGKVTHATCWVGPGPKLDFPDYTRNVPLPNREVFDWDLWLGPAPWRPFPGGHGIGGEEVLQRVRAFFEKHLRGKDVEVSGEPIETAGRR